MDVVDESGWLQQRLPLSDQFNVISGAGLRFAEEHMTEEQRAEIARGLFTVKEHLKTKGELHGLCPAHDDRNPSFSYNYKKDLCYCQVCDFKGDLVELWCHHNGLKRDQGGFKAFCVEFGINSSSHTSERKPVTGASRAPSETAKAPKKVKEKKPAEEKATPIPWEDFNALPALPEEWIQRLRAERGWTPDVIGKLGLRLYVHTKESAKKFRVKMTFGQKRVAIPVPDDDGALRNVRFYLPWDRGPEDEKLLSVAGCGEARLFPPPSQWGPGQLWQVEGEPDLLLALSLGLNAITKTTGARIWKEEWTEHFEGRDVVNLYDADKVGLAGNEKVGGELAPVAKLFRYIRWPKFMFEGTPHPLDDPKQKFSDFVQKEGRLLPANHGEDLTDFIMKHRRCVADLKDLLSSAGTIAPPEKPVDLGPRRFFGGKNGNAFKPALLAEALLEDMSIVSDAESGLIYKWNERYWERYNIAHIQRKAMLMLEREASTARASDAANMVRILSSLPADRRMDGELSWICLKNCMFNLDTGETVPHNPDFYFSYMLGVEFNPHGDPRCDRWLQFLAETIQDAESIAALQEFFGYCLTNDTRFEKCLIMIGPGSDGKSKVLDVLQALLGEQNCAAVGMDDLEKEFYRASLVGRKLNVSAEFDGKAFTSSWFKKLISGDLVSAAFKHKDFFEFRFTGKMVFAANRYPKVLDNTDGYWRRLLPIRFKRQFLTRDSGKDVGLKDKLLSELDGIFAWALAGLERLYEQEEFTWGEDMEATLQEYKATNDPVLVFCNERLLRHDSDAYRVSKAQLYKCYCQFCREGNFQPHNVTHFGRELRRVMPGLQMGKMRKDDPEARAEAWIGLELLWSDSASSSPSPHAPPAAASR